MSKNDHEDDVCRVDYETHFWHAGHPADVKFEIEKATRMLLAHDPSETAKLVFVGSSGSADPTYRARFCLDAAWPERRLYSLRLAASGPRKWFNEERLRQYSDKVFEHWTRNLHVTPTPRSLEASSPELYQQLAAEALAREAELAHRKEDQAPIEAVRQEVLAAIRDGKKCGNVNKEGQTTFYFRRGKFVREHIGDWDERQVFASGEAMLADLRQFYDWDTKRDTYPHRPPEVEAWRFIRDQLR
jgi:hypothetical protein